MAASHWVVMIADVRSSRDLNVTLRTTLPAKVRRAAAEAVEFAGASFRMEPEMLKGDEIQAVLRPGASTLKMVTFLRATLFTLSGGDVQLRVGLGTGTIDRLSSKGPFESDGQAFHNARQAIEAVKQAGGTRQTGWLTASAEFDEMADAMLGLLDALSSRWTLPQWLAVRERVEGKQLRSIAKLESVSVQSVSKRLKNASWAEFSRAVEFLDARAPVRHEPSA